MTERELKYLTDIYFSIQYIEQFIVDTPDATHYTNDRKTKSAVERELSIVGEAINQLHRLNPELPVSSVNQIISFRNLQIHSYHSVSDNFIWQIIKNDLPVLKVEVASILIAKNINPDSFKHD